MCVAEWVEECNMDMCCSSLRLCVCLRERERERERETERRREELGGLIDDADDDDENDDEVWFLEWSTASLRFIHIVSE